jgi:hypothetical protein
MLPPSSMNRERWMKYSLTPRASSVNAPAMTWSGMRLRCWAQMRTPWATIQPTPKAR